MRFLLSFCLTTVLVPCPVLHPLWQAYKYLMRYPSRRLCMLLNRARHEAFGRQAAKQVAATLPPGWPATKVRVAPWPKVGSHHEAGRKRNS